MRKLLCSLMLAGSLCFSAPGFSQIHTINETVESAVLNSPQIRAQFNDFVSSLEGQNVQRGELLPQLTVEGWTGRQWSGGNAAVSSSNWTRNGYGVQLRQLLFDGFATLNLTRQIGFEKLAGYYELLATVDKVALEAAEAYVDVVRYREMERLARENYDIHVEILEQIRQRLESGVGRGVDFEQAKGRMALAQANLMTESNNLNDVTQRYRRLVGTAPPANLLEPADLSAVLPKNPKDFTSSIRSNPAILAKQALFQASEYGVDAAMGQDVPRVELRASTGRDTSLPGEAYRNIQNSSVQVVMSYNLYRGGADRARIRQTKAQSYAARDVRDHTCRNLQQDLSVAWNRVQVLRQQMPFLLAHQTATEKVRLAYQQQFDIGERSLLDVLNTENELFDARRSLNNAQHELRIAEYRWLGQSHQILSAMGLIQPYKDQPEEAKKLVFPDEVLQVCLTPAPDTRNLEPAELRYRDDMLPPVISTVENGRADN